MGYFVQGPVQKVYRYSSLYACVRVYTHHLYLSCHLVLNVLCCHVGTHEAKGDSGNNRGQKWDRVQAVGSGTQQVSNFGTPGNSVKYHT